MLMKGSKRSSQTLFNESGNAVDLSPDHYISSAKTGKEVGNVVFLYQGGVETRKCFSHRCVSVFDTGIALFCANERHEWETKVENS